MKANVGIAKRILSFVLCLALMLTYAPYFTSFAAENNYLGGNADLVDLDTSGKYSLSLGDNASTEYAGRIWTDKSVYKNDVTFAVFGGGESTIKLNENKNGEDFLVAYSALATSEAISGQTQAPVDVVFIIDISGSMSNANSEMDNGLSRIANTVSAVNDAMEKLMAMNDYTRVSVVSFSNTAEVLLPLDHYTKWSWGTNTWNYLSLNSTQAGGDVDLYVRAVDSNGDRINKTKDVTGGTNIQMGLYTGMNVLAEESSITADINGSAVQRIPSVVLLSDGAPTYSSGDYGDRFSPTPSNWWAPNNNRNDGPGGGSYYGNGFKALMTGAYMKNQIDEHYKVSGTNYATALYTIGMGISELSNYERNGWGTVYSGDQDLAYFTLNPKGHWNDTNDMATQLKNAWESYTAQTVNGNGTVSVTVGGNSSYTVRHPQLPLKDIYTATDKDALKNLVNSYYDADNASAVSSVFEQIVSDISISAPSVPTELKGTDPMTDGYITYTDPIGKYMKVKDVKAIIYAGTTFTQKTAVTNGNVTTYTFTGEVHSPVYGDQSIANIIITVTTDANGDQTLTVKIPASVIPVRVNTVALNANGTVKTHTNNGAMPARVIYSVGLNPDLVRTDDDGELYIDKTKLDADYLAKNTTANGEVSFYTNVYTGANVVNGSTAGNATVEFEPSHSNKFYYILEDMPIYTDSAATTQATGTIDPNGTYYYRDEYYHGTSVEVDMIQRTGAQLLRTEIVEVGGYLYRKAGSPRLNRILKFEGTKTANATVTAQDFYAPTFVYAPSSTDPYEGKFVVYLGNNGVLRMNAGGNLQITKTVHAGVGLTAPDKTFEFTVNLDGAEVNQGTYEYVIVNGAGEQVYAGTVSAGNDKIGLKAGETATIFSLPPATTYHVTETPVAGFATQSTGDSGIIHANQTAVAEFSNTYSVASVQFPTNGTLTGQKELIGRPWSANDSFVFFIMPYNNAPLPQGYNEEVGVVVTAPDVAGGMIATFDFGTIQFTAPGVFRYTIVEKEPESNAFLPGMTYSRALYRLVVTVEDNGAGQLNVTDYDIQKLYDDSANALFTYDANNQIVMNPGQEAQDTIKFVNRYSVGDVVRTPVALKAYTDHSGQNPLVSGMFNFELKALGVVENNVLVDHTAALVPMPEGSANGVITVANEGHNITFPTVTFKQSHIPTGENSVTFRYQMREVAPAVPVNGMTYDSAVHTIDVVVSIDGTNMLNVSAIYPDNVRIITFNNTYTPVPTYANINGTKTLNGRGMKAGEAFEFTLGANAATALAIREGVVVVPKSTATVSGAQNGVATPFAFENIQFKKAGTYVFTVAETAGNAPAVQYDNRIVTVTVVVDDSNKDGNLEVTSITYSNHKNVAEFVNTYTVEFNGTPISLIGTKNLTGKTLLAGEFYFNVEERTNGIKTNQGLVTHTADEIADGNGVYTGTITLLDQLTYEQAGIYEYYITEQIPVPKVGGTRYDESLFRYTVVVEDVEKIGKLTVTSTKLEQQTAGGWIAAGAVVFNNTYAPTPATAQLPLINKVIAGNRAQALAGGEFSFQMKLVSATPANGIVLPATTVVTNAANGNVLFDPITFNKAGTYVVSIEELVPTTNKVPGIEYSTQVITATYTVKDDRNGNLSVILTQFDGGDVFINRYTAEHAEVTVDIHKNFTGRQNNEWLSTDQFDFEIVVLDPATQTAIDDGKLEFPHDAGSTDIARKSITAATPDKTVSGTIQVKAPGTYKFIIRELTGTIPGVHYDSNPHEVVIIATDNSNLAKIETVVEIDGVRVADPSITFNNVYDAGSTELSGHDHLTIEKIFTGRENNKWLDRDAFVFTLEPEDQATRDAINNNEIDMPNGQLTVSNANKAHPHFGNIVFHSTGTYRFKITERNDAVPGITYDPDPDRIVVVKVTDNAAGGALVATVDATLSEKLTFTNTYSTQDYVLEGAIDLAFTKTLVGRKWLDSDKFTFVLSPMGIDTTNAVNVTHDVLLPALTEITVQASQGHSGSVDAHFGNITFKKAGIYNFIITEKETAITNVRYDSHFYEIIVTVEDNGYGQLVCTGVQKIDSNEFKNTYTPDSVSIELKGEKKLNGNRPLGDGEFSFTVEAVTPGAPMPAKTTVANTAAGLIDFGSITYNAAGVYEYVIKENAGAIPGVTYDTNPVTATVTVTYDDATGLFAANVVYVKQGQQGTQTAFGFTNTYKATASEPVAFVATKKVTPSAGNSYTLKGGEFNFVIEGTQGAPMPAKTTVQNDANGKVDFGTVVFNEAGTYAYTIREIQQTLGGFTYDSAVYTVTVEVTDVIAEAKLKTAVTITDATGKDAAIVFDNKYNPKETSAILFGTKELNSEHKSLAADEFSFTIKAITQDAPMPAGTTVKNAATGVFQFDTITYTKAGIYQYEITENNLGKKGYTYDNTVYTVTVTVTDENAQLVAKVDGVGTAQAPIVKFVNKYAPDPVEVVLGAKGELTKEIAGRELQAEEFEFAVLDSNDGEVATAKNAKDGTFGFTLHLTKAGTYNYKLVEKNNAVAGVTYDSKVYGVQIVVVDQEGKLVAERVSYTLESASVEKVVFNNTYKAEGTDIIIGATKKLTGRELAEGEFKFVLKDQDGKVIAAATNTKDGAILFDKIPVTQAGTYKFTVAEEQGVVEYVTYDKSEYVVEIQVTDDGKGKLVASAPVIKKAFSGDVVSAIAFENTYTVPAPPALPPNPDTGDANQIGLWLILLVVSGGGLVGTSIYGRKKEEAEEA